MQIYVSQYIFVIFIRKADIRIVNNSSNLFKFRCIRTVGDLGHGLHHFVKPLKARQSLLEQFSKLHEDIYRIDEDADVESIYGQILAGKRSHGDEKSPCDQHGHIHQALKKAVSGKKH